MGPFSNAQYEIANGSVPHGANAGPIRPWNEGHEAHLPPQPASQSFAYIPRFSSGAYTRSLRPDGLLLPVFFAQHRKISSFEAIYRDGPIWFRS